MRTLVVAALWASLMVAATGVWLLAGLGWALVAGGLGTAAVLFFLVDDGAPVDTPEVESRRDRTLRQVVSL